MLVSCCDCFFFNDPATTEIYTLSLHDALPICLLLRRDRHDKAIGVAGRAGATLIDDGVEAAVDHALAVERHGRAYFLDRKSTRLNSSHANISYAVFCLKKKQTL